MSRRNQGGPASPSPRPDREALLLVGLTLLGFVVRVLFIGRATLWQDEMIFVSILATPTEGPGVTLARYWSYLISMGQMPLAGVLQNIYIHALDGFGIADAIQHAGLMRFPAVLLGTLAIPGVYGAAKRVLAPGAAWAAAILFAFSFYPVFYSREAYCYAHVLCFAAWGWRFWLGYYQEGRIRDLVLAALCLTGMGLSSLGSLVALGGWAAAAGLPGLLALIRRPAGADIRRRVLGVFPPAVGLLAGAPYLLHFMRNNTAHIGSGTQNNLLVILNDGMAKLLLGEAMPWPVLAWGLAVGGLAALILARRGGSRDMRVLLALGAAVSMVLLGIATLKTQYISARYFSPVAVPLYLVFGAALGAVANGVARLRSRPSPAAAPVLAGLLCLPHLLLHFPPYWRLENKHDDFRSIAAWLNDNLAPGMPYLLESAYQYRFIGGYHPTPGLIGAAPYVHGAGPGEVERLHQRQIDFMLRFPEAPFVESAHHNWDSPEGIWPWPHAYHTRHHQIRNDPLRRLIHRGIYPGPPHEPVHDHAYVTDIYYSTWEDIADRRRAEGDPVLFRYPDWTVVQVAQGEYRRAMPGNRGALEVQRLAAEPVTGSVRITGAVIAAQPGEAAVTLGFEGGTPVRSRVPVGQTWRVDVPATTLTGASARIMITLASSVQVQGLVLEAVEWAP